MKKQQTVPGIWSLISDVWLCTIISKFYCGVRFHWDHPSLKFNPAQIKMYLFESLATFLFLCSVTEFWWNLCVRACVCVTFYYWLEHHSSFPVLASVSSSEKCCFDVTYYTFPHHLVQKPGSNCKSTLLWCWNKHFQSPHSSAPANWLTGILKWFSMHGSFAGVPQGRLPSLLELLLFRGRAILILWSCIFNLVQEW